MFFRDMKRQEKTMIKEKKHEETEVLDYSLVNRDKNLFATEKLPLITVYDDNLFVRNDYDVLSLGQRNYLIRFFAQLGFKQKSGRLLQNEQVNIHLPRPNANLAISSFQPEFLEFRQQNYYCVTPTMLAETMFYYGLQHPEFELMAGLKALIGKCPFNIEWLRDISYRSDIEQSTKATFAELTDFQSQLIKEKFKMKKAL